MTGVADGPGWQRRELARYARHLALPGFGTAAQERLRDARVLVVGAGGLGSPVLLYLAAAGIGTIGIVDDDTVDASNLHRQVIHGDADVGRLKVDSARDAVGRINPFVTVEAHTLRLDAANAVEIVGRYDVLVDGTDSFDSRYLVSDAAEIVGVPVVWGAIHQFDGQLAVFSARPLAGPRAELPGVTYRDVFPDPPAPGTVTDCATGGVLGVLCGTVGTAMATEVVKIVAGLGRPLLGRLAVYDALDGEWRYLTVRADPERELVVAMPEPEPASCASQSEPAAEPAHAAPSTPEEISADELAHRIGERDVVVVDVREDWELAAQPFAPAGADVRHLPMAVALAPDGSGLAELPREGMVAFVCAAGARSSRVAAAARTAGIDATSLAGGVSAWPSA